MTRGGGSDRDSHDPAALVVGIGAEIARVADLLREVEGAMSRVLATHPIRGRDLRELQQLDLAIQMLDDLSPLAKALGPEDDIAAALERLRLACMRARLTASRPDGGSDGARSPPPKGGGGDAVELF